MGRRNVQAPKEVVIMIITGSTGSRCMLIFLWHCMHLWMSR